MFIHDWSRLDAGAFHSFHLGLVCALGRQLNQGGLPKGYYSLIEQVSLVPIPVLARKPVGKPDRLTEVPCQPEGAIGLEEGAFPGAREIFLAPYPHRRRTICVRGESNHHLVAMIEVLPPGWKVSACTAQALVGRMVEALLNRINVVLIDLARPGPHDPEGPHAHIQAAIAGEPYSPPAPGRLTFASYDACECPVGYVFHPEVGGPLPDLPLFLSESSYVLLRVEDAYAYAFAGVPRHQQEELAPGPDHIA